MSTFVVFGNLDRPFPRLSRAVIDNFEVLPKPVFIQTGPNDIAFSGIEHEESCHCFRYCSPSDFDQYIGECEVIICHCGVGVINQALSGGKFPAVMPRSAVLAEHVDNHQIDYAEYYKNSGCYYMFNDASGLRSFIINETYATKPRRSKLYNDDLLIADVQGFILQSLKGVSG